MRRTGRPVRPTRHEERVVLHVAGADLEDVGVLGDVLHLARLHDLGDDRQARPLARLGQEAQALARPRPWKAYGLVRGLNAPPRRIVAPAAFTASAVSKSCSRDSTAHGPAIRVNEPSPIATSPTRTMVSSGWNSREASLKGRLVRVTDSTAGQDAEPVRQPLQARPALAEDGDDDPLAAPVLVGRQALLEDHAPHRVQLLLGRPDRHDDEHLALPSVPPSASPDLPALPGCPGPDRATPDRTALAGRTKEKAEVATSAFTRHVPRPALGGGRSCRVGKAEIEVPHGGADDSRPRSGGQVAGRLQRRSPAGPIEHGTILSAGGTVLRFAGRGPERSHRGLVQRFAKPPGGVTCLEGSNPSLSAITPRARP